MRVLYLSGVVPFEFNAGYTLMFRHLSRLCGHEVLIVTQDFPPARGRALPHRAVVLPGRSRLFHRVANRIGSPFFWLELEASRIRRLARPHVIAHRPDLVLTVWGTPYLLAAADLAQELAVPLALVCHDDYEQMLPAHPRKRRWALSRLAPIYRNASLRLCVGPGMVEQLGRLYGAAPAEILYPIPDEAPPFAPAGFRRRGAERLRVGFFGEMGGNYGVLNAIADVLSSANAELHFFSHCTGDERARFAARPGIHDHGWADPARLRDFFRSEVDLTLVPQGFEPGIFELVRSCFPSKLPEACQIGLPLLVIGPREGSAVRWAAENMGENSFIDSLELQRVVEQIRRFTEPAFWEAQHQRVASTASGMFAPGAIHEQFERALLGVSRGSEVGQT